jgi:hypothetical protein
MEYIKVIDLVVEYRDEHGRIGVPTGKKTTGGAAVLFGECELLASNIELLKEGIRGINKYPVESEPVKVFDHDDFVIYHLACTWDEVDEMIKNTPFKSPEPPQCVIDCIASMPKVANVEVTGAARLYRAASVLTAGLGNTALLLTAL